MQRHRWAFALGATLLAASALQAEIIQGVMSVKGCEMSWWGGVARDAIARQFDVEKNTVKIQGDPGPKSYQPGTITFFAKKGKSIDIVKIHDSLRATRLSGGTNMEVASFEITATGEAVAVGDTVHWKVAGTGQELELAETAKLAQALKNGARVTHVTGQLQGWTGKFPAVLRALENELDGEKKPAKRMKLVVTSFQTEK